MPLSSTVEVHHHEVLSDHEKPLITVGYQCDGFAFTVGAGLSLPLTMILIKTPTPISRRRVTRVATLEREAGVELGRAGQGVHVDPRTSLPDLSPLGGGRWQDMQADHQPYCVRDIGQCQGIVS